MLAGGAAVVASPGRTQGLTPIRFSCDYRLYGSTAPFVYGLDSGLFAAQGLAATVDGSLGSADAITRVATGSYDFGCADVSTLVEFASRNPTISPVLVMPIYDRFPACIVSIQPGGIDSFKALEGTRLGVSTSDAGSRLLPALLRLRGIDATTIDMIAIDPRLRDTMLLRHSVASVIGFDYTVLFNLLGNGVPESNVKFVYFSDNGFDFYGQGLIASRRQIERNPNLVRAVATAVAQSWLASAANRDAAIESITRRDALADAAVEKARLSWVLDHHVLTPNVRANGLGTLDPNRLTAGISLVAEGFQLPDVPTASGIFDGRFIPPESARRVG